jgi:uncharacterized membrane protein
LVQQWSDVKDLSLMQIHERLWGRHQQTLQSKHLKLFAVEVNGIHAVGVVGSVMLAILGYLLSNLFALDEYLRRTGPQSREALRLVWVGIQLGVVARSILVIALLGGSAVLTWAVSESVVAALRPYFYIGSAVVAALAALCVRKVWKLSQTL